MCLLKNVDAYVKTYVQFLQEEKLRKSHSKQLFQQMECHGYECVHDFDVHDHDLNDYLLHHFLYLKKFFFKLVSMKLIKLTYLNLNKSDFFQFDLNYSIF